MSVDEYGQPDRVAAWEDELRRAYGTGDPAQAVVFWARTVDAAEDALRQAVTAARMAGVSWEAVGKALGTTKQAAWERYRAHERDAGPGQTWPEVDRRRAPREPDV